MRYYTQILNILMELKWVFVCSVNVGFSTNCIQVRTYLPVGNRSSNGAVFFVHGGGFVMGNTEIYEGLMRRMTKMLVFFFS